MHFCRKILEKVEFVIIFIIILQITVNFFRFILLNLPYFVLDILIAHQFPLQLTIITII